MFQALNRRVLEPLAFGLDISDLTLKFAELRRRSATLELIHFGEIEIPEGVVIDGEIKNEAVLTRILTDDLRTAEGRRLGGRYCVASLPEEKSFVRLLELPTMSVADIAHAVRWEVEGVVPLPFNEIYYDYELVPHPALSAPAADAAGHRDVLITAFPRVIVDGYERVIRSAGFAPLALELESQAVSRAIVPVAAGREAFVIVDIGAVRTSFIIFAGGSLVFTKSIAVGGRDFDATIAKGLGLPVAEGRQLKIEAGLNRNVRAGSVATLLEPLLERFRTELDQLLWFYRDHPHRKHAELGDIVAVYLCGGDANLIGIEKYLATALRRPVLLADPFQRFNIPAGVIPPVPHNQSLKYTTAIGLALRAAGC